MNETGAADRDGFLGFAGAPAFFGELRKSNRRRVLLDPASQFVNASTHATAAAYGLTVTTFVTLAVRPALSVTVRVITLLPETLYCVEELTPLPVAGLLLTPKFHE